MGNVYDGNFTAPVTSFPSSGLSCADCHEPQYTTPSGPVCVNGHGGADGYSTPIAAGSRTMPVQKPGQSKQDYGTPWELIHAIERQFGHIDVDLAARADNAKAPLFITPEENSLTVDWSAIYPGALGFLNPEFKRIDPWAAKCAAEKGLRIIMLTPASVGSNWFLEHVHERAAVLALNPRITFVGEKHPYPKDCMISLYNFGHVGFDVWRWK